MAAQTQVIGVNNNGWTHGFYVDQMGTTHGFTFNAGTYTIVDGAGTAFNQLLGINDGLKAVGYSSTDPMGATLQMSFKESGGTFTYVSGFPTGTGNHQAVGINAGTAVGFYLNSMGVFHGYIAAEYVRRILFYTVDDPSGVAGSTVINGINDLGQLVGFHTNASDGVVGFVASPTPEPGSLALMGSGMLAGLGFLRWKLMRLVDAYICVCKYSHSGCA